MILKNKNYICTLDIGSSKICAVLARMKRKEPVEIFFESVASKGVKEGSVVNSIELVGALSSLLKDLKTKSGINISTVNVNVSGPDIVTKHSRAIVPLAERGNKVVTAADTQKAIDQARILGSSLEEEIIHIIPSSYTIDSKSGIDNPIGLYGHSLEVDLLLVCARLASIQSLSRVINQSGYDVGEFFFSGLATAAAVFGEELKDGTHILCDIGSGSTQLLRFNRGILSDIDILPVGGSDLTAKLQETLKIPFDLAEEIKRSHGMIGETSHIPEEKEILVKKSSFYKPIKQKQVCETITPVSKALCVKIKEAVEKKTPLYQVKSFVAAGRTMYLEGFIEMLENSLSIPVKIGKVNNQSLLSLLKEEHDLAGRKSLTYLTAIGMFCLILEKQKARVSASNLPQNTFRALFNKFKEAYQEYF